jgi:hypothetical protein
MSEMLPLVEGEKVQARFRADRGTYWRDNAMMGAVGIAGAFVILALLGRIDQAGIAAIGVVLGIGLRAAYLASETLSGEWVLTDRRLLGPQGRIVMLLELETVRSLLSDVQLITKSGDKHLIKHQLDKAATIAAIEKARDRRRKAAK